MVRTEPFDAESLEAELGKSNYPSDFRCVVAGRRKRKLGDLFGLGNFGVNMTDLEPGASSALFHHHSKQDEFLFILSGVATLRLGAEEFEMEAGQCVGFKAGAGIGHQLINRSENVVRYLEIGDRRPGDAVVYPDDDLQASLTPEGSWAFSRKDGTSF